MDGQRAPGKLLVAVAAPIEARSVVDALHAAAPPAAPWDIVECGPIDLLLTGVGKANAAGAVAARADPERHAGILQLGIAGALPGGGLAIGDVVVATASVLADEGLLTPDGFTGLAAMGFPSGPAGESIPCHVRWGVALAEALRPAHRGPIATVSTCSGTDELAAAIRDRTGAIAEGMEGAAAGLSALRLGIPFAEVRVISNTTGDRECQVWDIKGAWRELGRVARAIASGAGGWVLGPADGESGAGGALWGARGGV